MKKAFVKAFVGFFSMTPMIIAVVAIVGLMQVYVTPEMLTTFFGHGDILDLLSGTLAGGISVGQGIISYVIADELMEQGISLYAISGFILAWVTLGLLQLPAEASVFGIRFTVYRNLFALISTILIAYLSVITLGLFS